MILAVIIKYQNRFPLTATRLRPRWRDSLLCGVSEVIVQDQFLSCLLSFSWSEKEERLIVTVLKRVCLVFSIRDYFCLDFGGIGIVRGSGRGGKVAVMEARTNSCGGLVAPATTRGHHLD